MNRSNKSLTNGDSFKRRAVSPDAYQCGCHWTRGDITLPSGEKFGHGDILIQCPIHDAATHAKVVEFEGKQKARELSSQEK